MFQACYYVFMTILGIDWGARRIGVAFATRNVASPLKVLKIKNQQDALEQLKVLVEDCTPQKIVIGVPLDSGGNDTKQSQEIRGFGNDLKNIIEAEVVFWNEALTSKQALQGKLEGNQGKNKRKDLDATSAAYILQSYLDSYNKA